MLTNKGYAAQLLEAGVAAENIRQLAIVVAGKLVRVVDGSPQRQ